MAGSESCAVVREVRTAERGQRVLARAPCGYGQERHGPRNPTVVVGRSRDRAGARRRRVAGLVAGRTAACTGTDRAAWHCRRAGDDDNSRARHADRGGHAAERCPAGDCGRTVCRSRGRQCTVSVSSITGTRAGAPGGAQGHARNQRRLCAAGRHGVAGGGS